jgi:NTE family protein
MKNRIKNLPIHFVLSGGAAKGFYHIGMLKAFEQLDIKPASITGTSAGALFGGLWALYGTYNTVKEKIDSFMESDIYKEFSEEYFTLDILNGPADTGDDLKRLDKNFSDTNRLKNSNSATILSKREKIASKFDKFKNILSLKLGNTLKGTKAIFNLFEEDAIVEYEDIENVFKGIYGNATFSDCMIPFAAISTNLKSKSIFIFQQGDIATAVQASTAVPFVLPAVKKDGMILYDGGIISNLPSNESKELFPSGLRVGLEVSSPADDKFDENANLFKIFQQIINTAIYAKQTIDRKICDLFFNPTREEIPMFAFHLKDSLIQQGYQYIIEQKDSIISRLETLAKNNSPKFGIFRF